MIRQLSYKACLFDSYDAESFETAVRGLRGILPHQRHSSHGTSLLHTSAEESSP